MVGGFSNRSEQGVVGYAHTRQSGGDDCLPSRRTQDHIGKMRANRPRMPEAVSVPLGAEIRSSSAQKESKTERHRGTSSVESDNALRSKEHPHRLWSYQS